MSTKEPPVSVLARRNVTLGFALESSLYCVRFIGYNPVSLSYTIPNAFSNSRHALRGSHIFGSVDSTKAKIGEGRREIVELPLNWID